MEKNIKTNQTLLENEIAKAIENLKSKSIEGLKRRQVLDERLLTLKKEEGLKQGSSSKYKLLDSLEKKLAETFQEYERSFLKWKQGKISFSETLLNQN